MTDDKPATGIEYTQLKNAFERGEVDVAELAERLSDAWARSYRDAAHGAVELVEVDQDRLTYLFDLANERVVGVYGNSDATARPYPGRRMRGFPLPTDEQRRLIRGHLAAHSVGGGTDINLVPQDRRLNVSAGWRNLERWAQRRPGSFLAVEVLYDDDTQTPARFVYLVVGDGVLRFERFENR